MPAAESRQLVVAARGAPVEPVDLRQGRVPDSLERSRSAAVAAAFQHCYPERFSHCNGCGRRNPRGHRLESYRDGEETVARFTVRPEFSGDVRDHAFGGMVATRLDCHGTASAAAFADRLAGREMGDDGEFTRFVTASLKADFLRPTPIGVELVTRGRLRGIEGRKVEVPLSRSAGGPTCATGEMVAVRFRE